jgi:5-methyltetrahydropteroyltriglutamate--homocysteine methyltransferase
MDLLELIRGKKVMVGAIDVATTRLKRRRKWPIRCEKRCSLSTPTSCTRQPTAAWRLSRQVANGKLRALSAGAEIIRQELGA